MRQEKAFSKDGFYKFVLDSNLMLHEHVAERGGLYFSDWLDANQDIDPVNVLDLACGGLPVSICKMMADCPQRRFRYMGVDLNPDQVQAARTFAFSNNLVSIQIQEGNAWELASLDLDEQYDIIFSGMNLHHGTPEEIDCLLRQCRRILSDRGLFINHDFFRPGHLAYLRRPDFNPTNPTESFAMISADTLAALGRQNFQDVQPGATFGTNGNALQPAVYGHDRAVDDHDRPSDWRAPFMQRYVVALKAKGASEAGIQEVVTHVMARDFPISTTEMREIAARAGFELAVLDLQASTEPLGDYFSLVIGRPQPFKTGL